MPSIDWVTPILISNFKTFVRECKKMGLSSSHSLTSECRASSDSPKIRTLSNVSEATCRQQHRSTLQGKDLIKLTSYRAYSMQHFCSSKTRYLGLMILKALETATKRTSRHSLLSSGGRIGKNMFNSCRLSANSLLICLSTWIRYISSIQVHSRQIPIKKIQIGLTI